VVFSRSFILRLWASRMRLSLFLYARSPLPGLQGLFFAPFAPPFLFWLVWKRSNDKFSSTFFLWAFFFVIVLLPSRDGYPTVTVAGPVMSVFVLSMKRTIVKEGGTPRGSSFFPPFSLLCTPSQRASWPSPSVINWFLGGSQRELLPFSLSYT